MRETRVIGKDVRRIDALAKVLGKATYSDDLVFPHMLYGKVLHSPYAHARIVEIDTSGAKQLSGVHAVLTAEDIQNNDQYHRTGDTWVLAEEEVRYVGDIVAIVAADSEEIAEEAIESIKVKYEALPAVTSLSDALSGKALTRSDKSDNVAMPLKVTRGGRGG